MFPMSLGPLCVSERDYKQMLLFLEDFFLFFSVLRVFHEDFSTRRQEQHYPGQRCTRIQKQQSINKLSQSRRSRLSKKEKQKITQKKSALRFERFCLKGAARGKSAYSPKRTENN